MALGPWGHTLCLSKDTDHLCQRVRPLSPETVASLLAAVTSPEAQPCLQAQWLTYSPHSPPGSSREQPSCVKIKRLKLSSRLHRGAQLGWCLSQAVWFVKQRAAALLNAANFGCF